MKEILKFVQFIYRVTPSMLYQISMFSIYILENTGFGVKQKFQILVISFCDCE